MEQAKVSKVCKYCGSENVSVDATARWNVDAQAWELAGLFDNSDCDDCGGETTIVEALTMEREHPDPAERYETLHEEEREEEQDFDNHLDDYDWP
jgi:type II secretory ATPase GspE/PulE/Tfp pilus assembly ATPase PilB-like protein